MTALGYVSFGAQGGDWGSAVTLALAEQDPDRCVGIHLNMVSVGPQATDDPTDAERAAIARLEEHRKFGMGYSTQQSTRPQTVGYGLVDSPAAQCAWIVEKFWAWADHNGTPDDAVSRDRVLDNVTHYWLPGAGVTNSLGQLDREHAVGIHLNMIIAMPDPATFEELTDAERAALDSITFYQDWDSGYSKQQSTRPQTLGYGLVDSPAGQCAWIVEKLYAWSDCDGHPENVFTRDRMLDNVMAYGLPGTGASSARLYWESFARQRFDVVDIPVACSLFPKEIFRPSRRWAEKQFTDLRYWNEPERGGHFAAFERPAIFVDEVRAAFRTMR